ncbi:MAG: DEAD/DEAH box helicase [Deltaproteobacteria bacterium]|jgi:DEAD/DEAH box helicase domain-containing protein|nr:DEAD/DEAH box helicase [Deltaproteobacteria bacterium]
MLPSVLAVQLRQGLIDYIKTTFPIANPFFKDVLTETFARPAAFYHEPYISVRLPFRVAAEVSEPDFPFQPNFRPYVHQKIAFDRLTGSACASTLVATGTGSGKTECFLYPILEYCRQNQGQEGVKALIVYPMNALATDQARRIAELIYKSPLLRPAITVGLYVGGFDKKATKSMGPSQVITDHLVLRDSPPDILLTNYKMLDYLLVRPADAVLWSRNQPETLKYVVVDEIHSFDGAQGTDLACLLRRLKARLSTPENHLCCVGTSATMGGQSVAEDMVNYAQELFGEPFEPGSTIVEDRISSEEFFGDLEPDLFSLPTPKQMNDLDEIREKGDRLAYLSLAAEIWLGRPAPKAEIDQPEFRLELGENLRRHAFFRNLLSLIGGRFIQISPFLRELNSIYPSLRENNASKMALYAFFDLISHARGGSVTDLRPFLSVAVYLWFRELRRLVAKVADKDISCALAPDLNERQAPSYLPMINCRNCGETGWVSVIRGGCDLAMGDLNSFYQLFFKGDTHVRMLFPYDDSNPNQRPNGAHRLCPHCLKLTFGERAGQATLECSHCGQGPTIAVIVPNLSFYGSGSTYVCPFCGATGTMTIVGLRVATTLSAVLSQLFASRFNEDKKTLAFSDNVQDAAQRAGFFNFRSFRFGLKRAIQAYVEEREPQPLDEFAPGLVKFYREKMNVTEFVSYFIAPDMTWRGAYEEMIKKGSLGFSQPEKRLLADVEKRLQYEITLEYGANSRLGRTLLKSSCSGLAFASDLVSAAASQVMERVANELNVFRDEEFIVFERMVLIFLDIMRSNGSINESVYSLITETSGESWYFINKLYLPAMLQGINTPIILCSDPHNFLKGHSYERVNSNKYCGWLGAVTKAGQKIDKTIATSIAQIIVDEIVNVSLAVKLPAKNKPFSLFLLNKSHLTVSKNIMSFVCDKCDDKLWVAAEHKELMAKTPCRRPKCEGHYQAQMDEGLNFYWRLYKSGELSRVIAKDHTGLIERVSREELETRFKSEGPQRPPWAPNVLSCTPTLELGINIGDLSTVILCNVPPTQAQFVQRVGRAGRKNGNSLSLTIANARPHDLFFYASPLDMVAGHVSPPSIFLEASAVLERQLTAYCLDCWVKNGDQGQALPETAVPSKIGYCLFKFKERDVKVFPFNFLEYVQNNVSDLLAGFLRLFSHLSPDTAATLSFFAQGDEANPSPLRLKIYEAFDSLTRQTKSFSDNIAELKKLINFYRSKPTDSSFRKMIKNLTQEKLALMNLIKSLRSKNVFNFLSDEGLLPNYAFPEAGVFLKAILTRFEGDETEDKATRVPKRDKGVTYEYNRSASAAIVEFAPNNIFYAEGRKLTISQIDLTTAQPTAWRLCPNCAYAKMETTEKANVCPKCGNPGWSDHGQVQTMLKVQTVYARADYDKSLIGDDTEARNPKFYTRQMLVDVDEENDVNKAFEMSTKDFPFGYEFVKKATLREINFGPVDYYGNRLMVNGTSSVRKGFRVCKFCGKIQPEERPDHTLACKSKNIALDDPNSYIDCLFLYREFQTEALRLLVPATTMDLSSVRVESFSAAFMLGMKEWFGNVDHLRTCVTELPVRESSYKKQYLVVYDSVPGGTGYLKQLSTDNSYLVKIFEKALSVMENCVCKDDPQKDGCYRCLYAYRQSQKIGLISRTTAINLLTSIVRARSESAPIKTVSHIPVDALFESELERRFIEVLGQMKYADKAIRVNKSLVRGKPGYLVRLGKVVWEVEPQVELNQDLEAEQWSRADFVFWPRRNAENKRPVAVFADGFAFHKASLDEDALKREAIRRANVYRVFVFSWKDVEAQLRSLADYATKTLWLLKAPNQGTLFNQVMSVLAPEAVNFNPDQLKPLDLFIKYLADPKAEALFKSVAKALAFELLDLSFSKSPSAFAAWLKEASEVATAMGFTDLNFSEGDTVFGQWTPRQSLPSLTIYAGVLRSDMALKKFKSNPYLFSVLDDAEVDSTPNFEAEWNGFWHFFNLAQFLPNFVAVSRKGLTKSIYHSLAFPVEETPPLDSPVANEEWTSVLGLVVDSVKDEARRIMAFGAPAPSSVGFELESVDTGQIVAEAELVWEEPKVAFLLEDQLIFRATFERQGFLVLTFGDDIALEIFQRRLA